MCIIAQCGQIQEDFLRGGGVLYHLRRETSKHGKIMAGGGRRVYYFVPTGFSIPIGCTPHRIWLDENNLLTVNGNPPISKKVSKGGH